MFVALSCICSVAWVSHCSYHRYKHEEVRKGRTIEVFQSDCCKNLDQGWVEKVKNWCAVYGRAPIAELWQYQLHSFLQRLWASSKCNIICLLLKIPNFPNLGWTQIWWQNLVSANLGSEKWYKVLLYSTINFSNFTEYRF